MSEMPGEGDGFLKKQTRTAMQQAAKEMDFLEAARPRDEMFRLEEALKKF